MQPRLVPALAIAVVLIAAAPAPVRSQDTSKATAKPAGAAHTFEFGGLLQVWYLDGHSIANPHDTYRVRRADLRFSGLLSPRVGWHVSVDASKLLNLAKTTSGSGDSTAVRDVSVDQRSRILLEASVNIALNQYARVDVGQQIIPLSLEGLTSSSKIETIERTMFIAERNRGGTYGDVRDVGGSMRGTVAGGFVDYQLGVFNEMGESQNNTDQNDQKAALGRLVFRVPMVPGLQVGGSGGYEGGATTARKERLGGEVQLLRPSFTLRTEVMAGRDGLVRRVGWYGFGAVRPSPDVEVVARWDNWDPDLHHESSVADVLERQAVLGANYYLDGGTARLAANVVRATYPSGIVPASNMLELAVHVAW